MSITLKVSVPNIGSLISTYNVVRVYSSSVSKDGPFTEITASTPQAGSITGSVTEPFIDLNGKTLIIKTSNSTGTNPDVAISFTDPNPISLAQVITAISTSGVRATASASASKLKLSSISTGQSAKLMIAGGSALADLGFSLYQQGTGSDAFIPLVSGQTTYSIEDPNGTNSYWYCWQFYNTSTFASSAVTTAIHPQDARIDPNRKVEDFRATKGLTLVRGREQIFRMAFWQDQAANIPLNPDSSGNYPNYSIFDINGELIATGKADIDGSAPNYKSTFLVPEDAVLSNDDRRWRIEWFMVTDTGRQVPSIEEFDVRDVDVTETESREQRFLALEGQPFRIRLRLPTTVSSITFTLTASEDNTQIIIPTTSTIGSVIDGDTVVYYYDVPGNVLTASNLGKFYTALWSIQKTPSSGTDFNWQIIDVPPYRVLRFFTELRQFIDKYQKRKGTLQAYEDSDLFTYLRQGLQYVNGIHPANLRFDLINIPPVMEPYWLLASLFLGLQAQQILEIDSMFSFSGQQITLDMDRSSALEGPIGRATALLSEGAKQTKMHLYRATNTVGAYAGRAYRITGNNNYVYQLSSGGSQSFLSLLQQVGLL